MKIDAHQHFWQYDPVRDSWIDNSMSVLKRDFMPDDLRRDMESCKTTGSIAVQADQSEQETRFLLKLAAENPSIKAVVGWVDLQADDVAERLEHFAQNPRFKGVRHIVQAEADERFMLRPAFLRGIQALADYNLTYDILINPNQLGMALELVRQFPNQPFVLDHIAKPLIKDQVFDPWKEQIQELAKYSNVYCKVSGLITEADWHAWKPEDIYPYLDIVFEAFGIDRLMFGSDWPVCQLAGSYEVVCELLSCYLKSFSEDDKNKIGGQNAVKFYNLE
ncbi:MAG: amidohydrolase family protein [Roseivirga sp.]